MPLPTKKKVPELDMGRYTWLLYGREKIGKTTLLSQWDDMLILPTEPGTKGLSIYEVPILKWEDMLAVVKDLEKEKEKFATVGIDTVTAAYTMALDYTCQRLGIPYPGESSGGREDFGKSWNQVKVEFTGVIKRIVNTGRGIVFTAHAQEIDIKHRSGAKYSRIIPSMPGQARKVIEALVDIAMYAEYFRDKNGQVVRALVCHGDELVWAGHRSVAGKFPSILPILEAGGYDTLKAGFAGEHPGLDPTTLLPAKEAFHSIAGALGKAQAEAKGEGGKPKPPPKKRAAPPKKAAPPSRGGQKLTTRQGVRK